MCVGTWRLVARQYAPGSGEDAGTAPHFASSQTNHPIVPVVGRARHSVRADGDRGLHALPRSGSNAIFFAETKPPMLKRLSTPQRLEKNRRRARPPIRPQRVIRNLPATLPALPRI